MCVQNINPQGPLLWTWSSPPLGSRLVCPTSPQVCFPEEKEVLCGTDALGTLLGPVTGLHRNLGLSG